MKTNTWIILPLVALGLFLSGCKKENNQNYSSITQVFAAGKPAQQKFVVDAASGGSITGAKGTVVTFRANSFINANGQTVTGNVNIELREVFSKKDMVYSGVLPVSIDGRALNSGGEFFIEAMQNGNRVTLRKGNFMEVRLPAQAVANNMEFFLGVDNGNGIVWQEPDSNFAIVDSQWVNSPVGSFTFASVPDSSYVINIDTTGWCNADAYMTSVNQIVDCNFTFSESFTVSSTNTSAYAFFDGTNSVWPLGVSPWGSVANNVINDNHLADIPMHILVITVEGGQLYAGTLAVTPANGGNYPINLKPFTQAELDALILSF